MSVEEMNIGVDEKIVDELMAEGFGDPVLDRCSRTNQEVILANSGQGEPLNEVPEGVPFQPLMSPPLTTDFVLWRCRLNQAQVESFARSYNIDPHIYRVFVLPEAGRMSTRYIPFPLIHFEVGFRLPIDPALLTS